MNEAQLRQRVAELEKENNRLNRRCNFLEEQFRLAQQKRFGTSSENYPGQGELFNEAEEIVVQIDEDEQESVHYTRKKPKRTALPKDLPRTRVVHDIDEADKVCDCCHSALHQIGEDISEKLEFIPAKVSVTEHVRPKYACKTCELNGTANKIKQAPMPPSVIPKGYATPSLIAQIITTKYQYGVPLYRQESMFKQYKIALSRKTSSDWMIKSGDKLQILYDRLKTIQLQQSVIHADETTLKVAKENKHTCYMWLYATGADSPDGNIKGADIPNVVLFDYHNSRSASCATGYLGAYQGYLQVDGYAGYHHTQATLVGCWAHARRKFTEAKTAQGKKPSGKADWALNHIQKLYRVEHQLKDKTVDERYQIRQDKSLPLLEQLEAWLISSQQQVLPKTKLGEAIQYCLNQWEKLRRYTLDGRLNIDNNRAERAIKPFVIGRKAWLFSQTANGANASAVLYSIIETAKANNLVPYDYLVHLLTRLSEPNIDIDQLLPWNVKLD